MAATIIIPKAGQTIQTWAARAALHEFDVSSAVKNAESSKTNLMAIYRHLFALTR
jgi:hypothetical protein